MDQDNRRKTLVLEDKGVKSDLTSAEIERLSELYELLDYISENCKDVDLFDVYMHGRHADQMVESSVWEFPQVKRVTFFFNSKDDMEKVKEKFGRTSDKFNFCLKNEVANRVENNHICLDLISKYPESQKSLKSGTEEHIYRLRMKQQNLTVPGIDISPIREVGFNAGNIEIIDPKFRCGVCSYILRGPVQLVCCGDRLCKSCVENCTGNTINCPKCHEITFKNEALYDEGFDRELQSLLIQCSLCNWNGLLKNYQDHLDQNHENPICNWCHSRFNSINNLNLHERDECSMIKIHCALKHYGCSDPIVRAEMSAHYQSKQHQEAIIAWLRKFSSKLTTDQSEGGSAMDVDNHPHTATSISGDVNTQLKEIVEKIDVLCGEIQAMNEAEQRLSSQSLSFQNMLDVSRKDFAKHQLSIQKKNEFLDGLKRNQEILFQDVASIKQKIEDLQFVSYDGTYTWKISNFAEKMADAQSERQTSIYSPPFYSSKSGYKMRARLYLHGNGNARRTHVSLFFVLMRSEYDAILKFPFSYKVAFCLFDQSGAQKHIIDSFRPDTKSNSFQRPRSEMNIASGIPKFLPLSVIHQDNNPYVNDDVMFIKVMVDFDNTPHPVWPDVFRLNQGLPSHVKNNSTHEMTSNYKRNKSIRRAYDAEQADNISRSIDSTNHQTFPSQQQN